MATIVITEFMDQPSVARLQARWDVHHDPDAFAAPATLGPMLVDARALIVRNRTQVTAELLRLAPALEVIGRLGVGLDNIDVGACADRGITVYPATGANDRSVAEYVLATAMILRRNAYLASARTQAGEWPRMDLIGQEIAGATLGLVGAGRIARETARLASALGMTVIAHDPHVPADDPVWQGDVGRIETLDALLQRADVVSLHVPLTSETRGLIDAAALSAMKPGAVLINAARGGIVDEAALAGALRFGHLGGAALDVYETEPPDAASRERFAGIANLILTPHIAGLTVEANARVSAMIADLVLKHLDGG